MPTPFLPDQMTAAMKQFEAMTKDFQAAMPKEFQGAANFMAHPAAMMAAGSAIGLGLASQAIGLWMGSVAGAAEVAQRAFGFDLGEADRGVDAFRDQAPVAARAKAAVETIIADAEAVVRGVAASVETIIEDAALVPAVVALTAPLNIAFSRPSAIDKPVAPDDLKLISGIGPKLEKVLNDLGVWTFGQIAAWGDEQVGWVDDYLSFRGRIGRDDWIGQATTLEDKARKN